MKRNGNGHTGPSVEQMIELINKRAIHQMVGLFSEFREMVEASNEKQIEGMLRIFDTQKHETPLDKKELDVLKQTLPHYLEFLQATGKYLEGELARLRLETSQNKKRPCVLCGEIHP